MKILFKNMGFGGGASQSLLQYVKVAKKNDIEVVVVGEHTYEPKGYKDNNIRLIDLPYFRLDKPINNFILLWKYLKLISKEKPDIIHAITQTNLYFHKIISKVTRIPIVYNIPGGIVSRFTSEVIGNEELLVFSEENKLNLISFGYEKEKITVISNRINTSESNNEYSYHYNTLIGEREIRFLLTSRMSRAHIHSIRCVVKIVENLKKDNFNVKLDILGDGEYFDDIKKYIEQVNMFLNEDVITLHGYKNNVEDYILKSDFIFGKGRSVIDGILNCRISFVVNEDYIYTHCNMDTFDNLRIYNFTGRNSEYATSYEELVVLIVELHKGEKNLNYLEEVKKLTREFYDVKLGERKILDLYKNINHGNSQINYKPNFIILLKEYIHFYIKIFKVRRKISK